MHHSVFSARPAYGEKKRATGAEKLKSRLRLNKPDFFLLPGGEILHTNHGDERIAISLETTPSSICFSFSENLNWISFTIKITLIIFPPFKLLWATWLFFFNSDGKRFNSNLQHWSVQAYPVINSSFYKSKYCSKIETLVTRAML